MARRKTGHHDEKPKKKKPALSRQHVVQTALDQGSNGEHLVNSHLSLQDQTSLLGDTRVPVAQRQATAVHIAQTNGNHYLQRMLAQLKPDDAQRQDEQLVEKGGANYEVVPGDSLWRIAETTYGAGKYWRDIYRANPGKAFREGNLILVGTILFLPVLRVPGPAPEPPKDEPPGGTDPAVEPYGLSTDFGSFDIYPDEFIGPLPLSERDAESWPIRQADFDVLMERLTAVKDGSSNLTVEGSDPFKTGVYLDLGWLMTSAVGQDLLKELQEAKHSIKIEESTGGNSEDAEVFEDGLETTDVPPKPGPGSNATVKYNPNRLFIKDGTLDWHHRPPAIGLAHEMIHAWTDVYGMSGRGKDADENPRYEIQAVGLGEYKEARISENKFRAAFGLPLRPVY